MAALKRFQRLADFRLLESQTYFASSPQKYRRGKPVRQRLCSTSVPVAITPLRTPHCCMRVAGSSDFDTGPGSSPRRGSSQSGGPDNNRQQECSNHQGRVLHNGTAPPSSSRHASPVFPLPVGGAHRAITLHPRGATFKGLSMGQRAPITPPPLASVWVWSLASMDSRGHRPRHRAAQSVLPSTFRGCLPSTGQACQPRHRRRASLGTRWSSRADAACHRTMSCVQPTSPSSSRGPRTP